MYNWLKIAKERGFKTAVLCCHGSAKGDYADFANSAQVFRQDKSTGGAQGHGIYLASYDRIANYYNCTDQASLRTTYPEGTFILSLLLVTDSPSYGAYTRYRVSGSIPVSTTMPHDDAYCVRDQALILPLGLAVGAKPGSKKKKRGT